MRKALIIGINYYRHFKSLTGCVNDAAKMRTVLESHADGSQDQNFEIEFRIRQDSAAKSKLGRGYIKDRIEELFRDPREVSLLYFSGHGHFENAGGYLMTSECKRGDDGVSMRELLEMVNESPALSKIVILDCCHAGNFGETNGSVTAISEGVSVLAASAKNQYSVETNGSGIFTDILVNALEGSAANILGEITPGSLYAHIDKSLGERGQRPIFKTNVRRFTVLRRVASQLIKQELHEITILFKERDKELKLDPSFEPTSKNPNPKNTKKFAILQKYNRVDLVVPVNEDHMYYAAMNSESCKLTSIGKFYWDLKTNKKM